MNNEFTEQLRAVVNEYHQKIASDNKLPYFELTNLQTRCISAIERTAGKNSEYYKRATNRDILPSQIGVATALLSDIENDYTKSFEELIHGNVFSDFIEMAEHLLSNGYKDAAAVIAGATLESHLRKLCVKFGVSTESNQRVKKAVRMNADLANQNAYSKNEQKSIISWLGIRNDAAHGNYGEYTKEQVSLLNAGIRDFIARHPA